jgi:hypothetical protein
MTRHIHGPDDEWCEECFGEADAPTETSDTQKAEEAKTASAVVNPYPHNSKERDLFNEGFFAGYLKDSEAEKYRRLVKAATEVERISSRDHNAWAELREALAPFKEEK